MMAQYLALKAEVPDCLLFYRMGDFFELFFDDARAASATLDIALTARGEHGGNAIPMCGVPAHSHEVYLARLIKGGHRVAIAEQTETPEQAKKRGGSKALVARGIVRIVTPGTLTEEVLLDARASNWLVAVAKVGGQLALAATDISTGRFEISAVPAGMLEAELARLNAAEVVAPEGFDDASGLALTTATGFDSVVAEKKLKILFGVATLDGWGAFSRAELCAAGGLLAYLDRAGQGALPFLAPPVRRAAADHMMIDAATRESLEIVQASGGGRKGSLLDALDRTVTGAGARLLGLDLAAPLTDRGVIDERLDLVGWLHDDSDARARLRGILRALPDIGRVLGRLAAGRGSPRDLGQLRDGLDQAHRLHGVLDQVMPRPALLDALLPAFLGHGELVDRLHRALVAAPPIDANQGGYIAEGYDPALDALRNRGGEGRREIAALEARYRATTGISQLKIRHNNVLGYHVEVPARVADPLMKAESGFTHRQTLAGVVRFNAPELHEQATTVGQAGAHALAAEAAHLEDLIEQALGRAREIAATADALAPAGCRGGSGRARGRRRLVPAGSGRTALSRNHRRPASRGRERGGRHRRALRRQRLPAGAARSAVAGHRPQYGRQIDLPAPECRNPDPRAGRQLRARRQRPAWAVRPAVQPGRRVGQSGARAIDLHGRDGRDGGDPRAGDRTQLRHPR
jgi:DNA mismatch repair protein MutS